MSEQLFVPSLQQPLHAALSKATAWNEINFQLVIGFVLYPWLLCGLILLFISRVS